MKELFKVHMGIKQVVNIISSLIFVLTLHQDHICFLTEFIDVKMQFLMVTVQNFKSTVQPCVQLRKLREEMLILNRVMTVKLLQKEATVAS